MADPFNSRDGYSTGIPPIQVIDGNGNVYTNYAQIGNITISGDTFSSGNIVANVFIGTFQGNIEANIVVPGANTDVLYNDNGTAGASGRLTFNASSGVLTVRDTVIANAYVLGTGTSQFSSTSVVFATTASTAINQVLTSIPATGICSIDVTIIATDTGLVYRQISKLFAGILGTEVDYNEYGTIDVPSSSPGVADFAVNYNSGNIQLVVTPLTSNLIEYKISVTTYKE